MAYYLAPPVNFFGNPSFSLSFYKDRLSHPY